MKNAVHYFLFLTTAAYFCGGAVVVAEEATSNGGSIRVAPLEGRIEQTADFKVPLPAKLTVLKAQVPKMDTSHRSALQGGVSKLASELSEESFPENMLGYWGGTLKIASIYHMRPLPDVYEREGSTGLVVFHFVKEGSEVKLKPASIFMQPVTKRLQDSVFRPARLEQMKEMAKSTGKKIDPNQLLDRNPIISLAGGEWAKLGGATGKATMTSNTLHTLDKGVIEQDIVSKYEQTGPAGGRRSGYLEVICRFKENGSDSRFVQVAKIRYAANGAMSRRVLFEGTVTRDWQKTADKISTQLNRPWDRIALMHDI